jgi:hypothetical protein
LAAVLHILTMTIIINNHITILFIQDIDFISFLISFNHLFLGFHPLSNRKKAKTLHSGFGICADGILAYRIFCKAVSENTRHSNTRSIWNVEMCHFLWQPSSCSFMLLSKIYSYLGYSFSVMFYLFVYFCV